MMIKRVPPCTEEWHGGVLYKAGDILPDTPKVELEKELTEEEPTEEGEV